MEDIYLVGKYLSLFPVSSNLPTYSDVFRKFMFHLRTEKRKPRLSAQLTTQALKESWNKKDLKHLIDDVTVELKILRYYETWRSLQKTKLRMSATETEKRMNFSDSLKNLFDIAKNHKPRNKKEQKAFRYLEEQREQLTLQATSESVPTETISCSDFEEEETNLQVTTDTNPPASEQEETVPSISTIGEDLQIPGKC